MTFTWTDRDGGRHDLTRPKPIEDEAEAVAGEIDRSLDLAAHPEPMIRDTARAAIRSAHARLETLRSDLVRWNAHADAATLHASAELAKRIDDLPRIIAAVMLVVALHDEHDRMVRETAADPQARAARLADQMTETQRRAVAATSARAPLPEGATRESAKAWLDTQPGFGRPGGIDGGWFAWTDCHGHAHRLQDPLPIEREMVATASELEKLRPDLSDTCEPASLEADVIVASASWDRLRILQCELDRFDREAKAREETQWSKYAVDWRAKRRTT